MFQGADSNALAMFGIPGGGSVAGVDFVGATPLARPGMFNTAALPQAMAPQRSSFSDSDSKIRSLQQLAMANYVPQIQLGVGDSTTKVKAGATISFSPEPSVPLRVTQFTVPGSLAPFFVINSLTIARVNLLAGASAVPAEMFVPNARHAPLENPILSAGSIAVVSVTNIDANDHLFLAAFTGIDLTTPAARMIP